MEYIQQPTTTVGYLIVEAKTADGALPVSNAIVTVEGAGGVGNVKITQETNRSGRTERIALPTVSSALSQTYENRQPFTIYDIYVTAEGFYPFRAQNVPIFSGVTTLQPAAMIGLSARDSQNVFPKDNTSVNDREPFSAADTEGGE